MVLGFMRTSGTPKRRGGGSGVLQMYKAVRLRSAYEVDGIHLEMGLEGVVVDRHGANDYGVEFADPIKDVLILPIDVLESVAR